MDSQKERCGLSAVATLVPPRYQDLQGEPFRDLPDESALDEVQARYADKVIVLLVSTHWHPGCAELRAALQQAAPVEANLRMFGIDGERVPEVVRRFGVESVPALVLIKPCAGGFQKFEGGRLAARISGMLQEANEEHRYFFEKQKFAVYDEIDGLLRRHLLVVCSEGAASNCPLVALLTEKGFLFETYDVRQDWRLHQWLKFYAQTQQFPQVYARGKFVATGAQFAEDEDLLELLPDECMARGPLEKLKLLLRLARVVVFMEGSLFKPEDPNTSEVLESLEASHVRFTTFDVTQDKAVANFLQEYADSKQLPQIFLDGQHFGSLKELRSHASKHSLSAIFPTSVLRKSAAPPHMSIVQGHAIVLFMKGTPEQPQCGYSRKIVELLTPMKYFSVNVLDDPALKESLKLEWPTFPQLWVKGKLVGGVDIVEELHESGGFDDLFAQI